MPPSARLLFCPAGPAAAAALRDYVRSVQGADPLAPVTVVGPSPYANLALRRELGRTGFANVGFVAFPRLADLLGGPSLAAQGRRPLTPVTASQALRQAVRQNPGPLNRNGYHPATHQTLKRTINELAALSPEQKAHWRQRGSPLSRHALTIEADFRQITGDRYTESADLFHAAANAVRDGMAAAALADLGFILFFQPRRVAPAQQELIAALAAADRCALILPLVNDDTADAPARQLAERLTAALGPPATLPPPAAAADETDNAAADILPPTRLLIAQDAQQEIRWVIRSIFRQLSDGTPLHRIAILYRQANPYAALIPEELELAGLPLAGPNPLSLAQTPAGRALTGILSLAQGIQAGNGQELPREEVAAWLTSCPLRFPGGLPRDFNPSQWDHISRQAGILRGLAQWQDNLNRFAADQSRRAQRLADQGEISDARVAGMQAEAQAARRLRNFITDLASAAAPPPAGSSWAAFAHWAGGLLDHYGPPDAILSDTELSNSNRISQLVASLAELDNLPTTPDSAGLTFADFRETLAEHLAAAPERLGIMGQGIFVAPLDRAAGITFDAVHIVGMVEGAFPPPFRESPLLPDSEAPPDFGDHWRPSRSQRLAEQRGDFLAALNAAPRRALSYPVADTGGSRRNHPSRWFLEQASILEGTPVRASTLSSLLNRRLWLTAIGSPQQDFATIPALAPADAHDYDLAQLWHWQETHGRIHAHPLAQAGSLAAGLQLVRGRSSPRFSQWNGNLSGAAGSPVPGGGLSGATLSPTGLEKWAACPFRYFLGQQLRLSQPDSPEDIYTISALERGSLIHEILEKFLRQARADDIIPPPGQPWPPAAEQSLLAIAAAEFQAAANRGVTGRPLLWQIAQADLRDDLLAFLDADTRHRQQFGLSPLREEAPFGIPDAAAAENWPAAAYQLPDGSAIRFRGIIDRVDASPDGRDVLVLDYKTGGSRSYTGLDDDSIDKGQRLQLSIYSLAAQQALGPGVKVRAAYWFVSSREGFKLLPQEPVSMDDDAVRQRFDQGIAAILAGIRGGVFPANPGPVVYNANLGVSSGQNCHYCDFDSLCPSRRSKWWENLKNRPENRELLAPYLQLSEPAAETA